MDFSVFGVMGFYDAISGGNAIGMTALDKHGGIDVILFTQLVCFCFQLNVFIIQQCAYMFAGNLMRAGDATVDKTEKSIVNLYDEELELRLLHGKDIDRLDRKTASGLGECPTA